MARRGGGVEEEDGFLLVLLRINVEGSGLLLMVVVVVVVVDVLVTGDGVSMIDSNIFRWRISSTACSVHLGIAWWIGGGLLLSEPLPADAVLLPFAKNRCRAVSSFVL